MGPAAVAAVVSLVGSAAYALAVAQVWLPDHTGLAVAELVHHVSGDVMGLGYVCLFGWLAAVWGGRTRHGLVATVTAVGERSLTCYLLQSVLLAPLLSDWGRAWANACRPRRRPSSRSPCSARADGARSRSRCGGSPPVRGTTTGDDRRPWRRTRAAHPGLDPGPPAHERGYRTTWAASSSTDRMRADVVSEECATMTSSASAVRAKSVTYSATSTPVPTPV